VIAVVFAIIIVVLATAAAAAAVVVVGLVAPRGDLSQAKDNYISSLAMESTTFSVFFQ